MEVKATIKFARISPKKAAATVAALRRKKVVNALQELQFTNNKTAGLLYKLIHSAVANAKNNYNLKEDNLLIKTLTVSDGPRYKRYWLRSRGSADTLLKRTSHFNVVLAEIKPSNVKKPVATPIKPVTPTEDKGDETKVESAKPAAPHTTARPKITQGIKKVFKPRTTNK